MIEKKSILIFSHAMEIGGAEKALLGLLEAIDKKRYSVDLFLMRHYGELLSYIPEGVRLLPEISQYASLAVPAKEVLKKGQLGVAFGRYKGKKAARKRVAVLELPKDNDVSLQYSHLYTLPFMPEVSKKEYDLAISFLTPHYFALEKVHAKKKIAWIHTDYSTVAIDVDTQLAMWERYDRIVSISPQVTKSFLSVFPSLETKVTEIQNIMPISYMRELESEFAVDEEMPEDGSIHLLSIGRFCTAKNFDNVPDICKKILKAGINVKWYLIGFGPDESMIQEKIEENGMQEHVMILGKKNNPYPYIKACDLYVQPSRYEGKCVSVVEAQILQKPVVITAYKTSASQLLDGVDGVIVPQDNEGCAQGIIELLKNAERMTALVENCKNRDYSNRAEVEKLYRLIEEQ